MEREGPQRCLDKEHTDFWMDKRIRRQGVVPSGLMATPHSRILGFISKLLVTR